MAIYKIVQIKSNGLNVYIVIITVFVFIASGIVGLLDLKLCFHDCMFYFITNL